MIHLIYFHIDDIQYGEHCPIIYEYHAYGFGCKINRRGTMKFGQPQPIGTPTNAKQPTSIAIHSQAIIRVT